MGQTTLVGHRIQGAHQLVDCLDRDARLSVWAAYWIEDLDDQRWSLHIVTPDYEEVGPMDPDRVINATLRDHPGIDLDSGEIRPRPTNDRQVVEITNFIRDYPAAEAFRLGGVFLKGRWVESSYIYPIKLGDMVASVGRGDS